MKRDFLVIGCLLAAGLLMLAAARLFARPGGEITVTVDGEVWGVYDLGEDARVEIETEHGRNLLVIEAGEAWMEAADCPDGYCCRQKPVHLRREQIVCLPHGLIAAVTGGAEASLDAVAG